MLEAIFDHGLQEHAGDKGFECFFVDMFDDVEIVAAEAGDFDIEIVVDERELFAEGHEGFVLAQQAAQDVAELQDNAPRGVWAGTQGASARKSPICLHADSQFNQPVAAPYSERDDIIVISDEAHRTQGGKFARNMRLALPNASFIGFTGTPLFKHDELTRRIFGNYVSRYDFKRSEEDQSTVKLVYENRGEKLGIATGAGSPPATDTW